MSNFQIIFLLFNIFFSIQIQSHTLEEIQIKVKKINVKISETKNKLERNDLIGSLSFGLWGSLILNFITAAIYKQKNLSRFLAQSIGSYIVVSWLICGYLSSERKILNDKISFLEEELESLVLENNPVENCNEIL